MPLDIPSIPPGRRPTPPSGVLLLITLAVLGLLAAAVSFRTLVNGPSAPVAVQATRQEVWLASAEPSPRTPDGFHLGPGAAADSGGDVPTVVNPPPATPLPTQGASAASAAIADNEYCGAVRSGLGTLTGSGLGTLKALTTSSGNEAPSVRAFVEQALHDASVVRDSAPPSVRAAANTVATAWNDLSAELAREGYDRPNLISLAIKYLASPGVASAWESLAGYTTQHCGINLNG